MKLSICIITKNQAEKLSKCLLAIQKAYKDNCEIVVVDTGSIDDSINIAKKYTQSVYFFKWCDDFSAAKNYAISKAKNDYVMVIDSDEYIYFENERDYSRLENEIEYNTQKVGRIRRINRFKRGNEEIESYEYINRIFNRKLYAYNGRIHEQVVRRNDIYEKHSVSDYETYITSVNILHDGYSGTDEEIKSKAKRNIHLLLTEYENNPNDTYIMYQIGKGYYMLGDYHKSIEYYELALGYDINPKLEYVIDMIESYGYALLETKQANKALTFENIYEEFGNNADFDFLMGLIYMNNMEFDNAVNYFIKATKYSEARTKGKNSYLAFYNAGVIYECLGKKEEARNYYSKCDGYGKAQQRIRKLEK